MCREAYGIRTFAKRLGELDRMAERHCMRHMPCPYLRPGPPLFSVQNNFDLSFPFIIIIIIIFFFFLIKYNSDLSFFLFIICFYVWKYIFGHFL